MSPAERLVSYVAPGRLHTTFNFDHLWCEWTAASQRAMIQTILRVHGEVGAPPTWVIGNHDTTRVVTRYGKAETGWRFLAGAGLVGGGPTFAGSVLGYAFVSPVLSILFLGLAAGALIFVFNEMMAVARRFSLPMVTGVALTIGLLAAFGTDFILSAAGA